MFGWKKKFLTDRRTEIEKRFSALLPKPVVSIAKLGSDGLVDGETVDFIFLIIEEKYTQRFAILSSKAIQIAIKYDAIVVANVGGLMQFVVGPRNDLADCTENEKRLQVSWFNY